MEYLLNPTERKNFTISKLEAMDLAKKLAYGQTTRLRFQSVANRNWVAKLARTKFGANVTVDTTHNQLLDPRYTVEARNMPNNPYQQNEKHWFNSVYKVELAPMPRRFDPEYEGRIW